MIGDWSISLSPSMCRCLRSRLPASPPSPTPPATYAHLCNHGTDCQDTHSPRQHTILSSTSSLSNSSPRSCWAHVSSAGPLLSVPWVEEHLLHTQSPPLPHNFSNLVPHPLSPVLHHPKLTSSTPSPKIFTTPHHPVPHPNCPQQAFWGAVAEGRCRFRTLGTWLAVKACQLVLYMRPFNLLIYMTDC